FAHYKHGDVFQKAYDAFSDYVSQSRDQAAYQRVMNSADPGEELVKWHREGELHRELGGKDLASFLETKKQEWMKDPQFQAAVIETFKANQQPTAAPSNNINLPPSLSKAAAARSAHDDGGHSGKDIYAYATAKR